MPSRTFQYVKAVKNASEEQRRLLGELAVLQGLLNSVQKLGRGGFEALCHWGRRARLEDPKYAISELGRALEKLNKACKRRWRKCFGSMVWPFKVSDMIETLYALERHKAGIKIFSGAL